jgi:hypothetical protein
MATLSEIIQKPDQRQAIVADANVVLDQEVADKSGLAGLAVKGAFALVKGLQPGIIPHLIDGLLPDFCQAVDPILAQRPVGAEVAGYLTGRTNDVVQGLLAVTDGRARKTPHQTLLKAYQKLRPTAEKHVAAAIPRVAAMVAKHVNLAEKKP